MNSPTLPLAEIAAKIDYGLTASASEAQIGPKFLRITDIQDDSVNWDDVPFCEATPKKLAKARIEPGDIVFARTGATTGKSFLIHESPEDAVFASYLIRVRPSDRTNPSYLAHFFRSQKYWSQIKNRTRGAAQGGVNATSLGELEIPLPSLDEQRRIAGILDAADALRRRRREALALLDTLPGAIFAEMFGEPSTNKHGYKLGMIGDLLDDVRYGTSNKAGAEGELPILRMGNITYEGRMDLRDIKRIDLPKNDIAKHTVRKGDILFNRTNSADLVGKTAIFNEDEPYAFAGYLVRARVSNGNRPEYVAGYLNSPHGKKVLRNMAKSIVGMANINAKEMQKIPILLAPEDQQESYAERCARIDERRASLLDHLSQLETLFASLQSRAFAGAL